MNDDNDSHQKKSGTVALVGRPNAGKSTLMNAMLREKLAIVSNKPQTTRHRIVGILSEDHGQMVFWDTPGIHKPLFRMNRRMMQAATDALRGADVVCLVRDASQPFGNGDRYALASLEKIEAPRIVVLNKIDRMKKSKILPEIERYDSSGFFEDIIPTSALEKDGTEIVLQTLWKHLPVGEPLYDPALLTVHTERFLVAERIREKVLERTHAELPYTTAVAVEGWQAQEGDGDRPGRLLIAASILVEKPSHKKIVIGAGGRGIKEIGIAARKDLEEFLERKVHLDLHVRHEPGWREKSTVLNELDRGLSAF